MIDVEHREKTNSFTLRHVHNEERSAENQDPKSADWVQMSSTRKEEISLTARSFVQLIDRDALRQHVEEEQKQSNRPPSIMNISCRSRKIFSFATPMVVRVKRSQLEGQFNDPRWKEESS
jgi:hypothetical protein